MAGGKKKNNKIILNLFFKFKGKCAYCGNKVKINSYKKGMIQKDNNATIEHVYPKLDIRRFISNKRILACYKCNSEKGHNDYNSVFNNGEYKDIFYGNNEYSIYNGLLITMLKSYDNSKYLI